MTHDAEWQREWEVLRAERDLARRRWRGAADGLAARARDPLGLGRLVRRHPAAAAGIGAAIAALVAKLFLGRSGAQPPAASEEPGAAQRNGTARPAPAWTTMLRDAAISVAVPWLLRLLQEKAGPDARPSAAPEPERARDAVSEPAAHSAPGR